jgi:SAM-dependent methyltransferase
MNSYEIIQALWQLDKIYYGIYDSLDSNLRTVIDKTKFDDFKTDLLKIVEHNKIAITEKSSNISNRMDPNKLSHEQYEEFYQNIKFSEEEYRILRGKFTSLISFEFPVLELFPGNGVFTSEAVAGEPLYIADYYMENLEKVGSIFNDFYNNRRLIKYQLKDFNLSGLPQNQFGLIFCYCYFMAKDREFIANWAREVIKVLRPGGYFIFNFVPIDTYEGLLAVERHSLTAVDHDVLQTEMTEIGYEFIQKDLTVGYASTMLFKKPGEIKLFKLTSNLAKIIDNSVPFV